MCSRFSDDRHDEKYVTSSCPRPLSAGVGVELRDHPQLAVPAVSSLAIGRGPIIHNVTDAKSLFFQVFFCNVRSAAYFIASHRAESDYCTTTTLLLCAVVLNMNTMILILIVISIVLVSLFNIYY